MIAYIQLNRFGNIFSESAKVAEQGFKTLGIEIREFKQLSEISILNKQDIVIGGVSSVNKAFNRLNISPTTLEYPEQLRTPQFLGRNLWQSTIKDIMQENNIFIKPIDGLKAFTGFVKAEHSDLSLIKKLDEDTKVWCSSVINIESEYRCFIQYGKILDIRWYKGNAFQTPSLDFICDMIKVFTNAPKSYTLDVGITFDNRNVLIEVNDAYSISSYGLSAVKYAKFLYTRWADIMGVDDILN